MTLSKKLAFSDASMMDGEVYNANAPETFEIPEEDDRWSLKVGDFAKIELRAGEAGERFWVKISNRRDLSTEEDERVYSGAVDNDLVMFDIPFGETLDFDPCHVLSIIRETRH